MICSLARSRARASRLHCSFVSALFFILVYYCVLFDNLLVRLPPPPFPPGVFQLLVKRVALTISLSPATLLAYHISGP
ncbi:hypothetical protein QBC46DRAFT_376937 [Diplogelasinospora grovesii]|uniref:Uncharacterized protein n=1 Tax=Diplogelasinospora grovesii TaxID=303347 RepID=A0AAN6NDD1_9PEZI|nr:hypothetical protein QBC46DRAFT_376937 [Diplogelasinospora grovesii]